MASVVGPGVERRSVMTEMALLMWYDYSGILEYLFQGLVIAFVIMHLRTVAPEQISLTKGGNVAIRAIPLILVTVPVCGVRHPSFF